MAIPENIDIDKDILENNDINKRIFVGAASAYMLCSALFGHSLSPDKKLKLYEGCFQSTESVLQTQGYRLFVHRAERA